MTDEFYEGAIVRINPVTSATTMAYWAGLDQANDDDMEQAERLLLARYKITEVFEHSTNGFGCRLDPNPLCDRFKNGVVHIAHLLPVSPLELLAAEAD